MFEGNLVKRISPVERDNSANDDRVFADPGDVPNSLKWNPQEPTPEQSSDSNFQNGEVIDVVDMTNALLPEKENGALSEENKIKLKRNQNADGRIVYDLPHKTSFREPPLRKSDYEAFGIHEITGPEQFTVKAIQDHKEKLIGLGILSPETRSQDFMNNPNSYEADEIIEADSVFKENETLSPSMPNLSDQTPNTKGFGHREEPLTDLDYAALGIHEITGPEQFDIRAIYDKKQELVDKHGLQLPGVTPTKNRRLLAQTKDFFDKGRADDVVAGYQPIEELRPIPKNPPTLGYTATVHIPKTPDDSFKPKTPPPLDMRHFQRGQRLPPLTPKGNEPVTPKPGIFKRLKTEFLERFWYR